jgi:hypothetical protein
MQHFVAAFILLLSLLSAGCDRDAGGGSGGTAPPLPPTPEIRDIDPKALQPGPIRHESLTDEQMARVRKLVDALREVDHSPLEKWVDDFKRDLNPDNEIEIWEAIAKAYASFTGSRSLDQSAKEEVFKLLLLRSMMTPDEALRRVKLKALSEKDARDVLALYGAPPRPITVTKEPLRPAR